MNTVKNVRVELTVDSKKTVLQNYVLVQYEENKMVCYAEASLVDWARALEVVLNGFCDTAVSMSDQEIYEACEYAGLDFDTVKNVVERNYNG